MLGFKRKPDPLTELLWSFARAHKSVADSLDLLRADIDALAECVMVLQGRLKNMQTAPTVGDRVTRALWCKVCQDTYYVGDEYFPCPMHEPSHAD